MNRNLSRYAPTAVLALLCMTLSLLSPAAGAQGLIAPRLSIGVGTTAKPQEVAVTIQILILMTLLSLAPSLLILMTSFTRIIIVFSLLRSALGAPQIPPNQVMVGLALFLTLFIMQPTITAINQTALKPYMTKKIGLQEALDKAEDPLRQFMIRQTYKSDLSFFINLSHASRPRTAKDVSMITLIPAFLTSELKTAFIIGFYIYLPFLVIDIVVASTLMSMGMMMLPPTVISLPAKLLLFVLADGWTLLIGSLAHSFR